MNDICEKIERIKIENNLSSGKGVRLRHKKNSRTSSKSHNESLDLTDNHVIGETSEIDSDDSNYEKREKRRRIIRTESKKEKYNNRKESDAYSKPANINDSYGNQIVISTSHQNDNHSISYISENQK